MSPRWLSAAGCLALAGVALAQKPRIYSDPANWFSIQFPGNPAITGTTYDAVTPSGGKVAVPAKSYAVKRGGSVYRVTVADYAETAAEDRHALDYAVASWRKRDDLALDTVVSHSLGGSGWQLCGRHFGYAGADGTLNYETLFYNPNTKLFYDIFSSVSRADQATHGAEAVHFQQSLALQADPAAKLPPPPNYPANWQLQTYADQGFSIRFPGAPTVTRTSYRTEQGITVPATSYVAKERGRQYRLIIANLWETEADTPNPVDQAVALWKQQGTVLADDAVAVGNGQCGRDVTLRTADGGIRRAEIFFPSSQHRLYFIEVTQPGAGAVADPAADRLFQSSFVLSRPE